MALIAARGGSKGLPNKNILNLGGRPLIAHSIISAKKSKLVSKIVVASDSLKILALGKKYGAETILLPKKLTGDKSPVLGSVFYTLDTLKKAGENFDAVALLEPTSPLRKDKDIDSAIKILLANWHRTDAVVSLGEVHLESPYIMKKIVGGYIKPLYIEKNVLRQMLPKTYFPYGVIYLCKTEVLKKQKTFYPKRIMPYLIARSQNYEIDDAIDFACVGAIIEYDKKRKK